jgi:hypothetical protein
MHITSESPFRSCSSLKGALNALSSDLPFVRVVQRVDEPLLTHFHNLGEAVDFSQSAVPDRLLLIDEDPGQGIQGKTILSSRQEPVHFGPFRIGYFSAQSAEEVRDTGSAINDLLTTFCQRSRGMAHHTSHAEQDMSPLRAAVTFPVSAAPRSIMA